MKNLTKIFMAVVAGMFAFSCVTDTTMDQSVNLGNEANGVVKTVLSVSIADSEELRTQLGVAGENGYPMYWSNGDKISVNGVESNALELDEATATAALFGFSKNLATPYCIAYPAAAEGQVEFSANQSHTSNTTFGNNVAAMWGYSEDGDGVELQHLTGVLKIGVTGTAKLVYAQVSTADRAPIAGTFDFDFVKGEATPTTTSKNVISYSFGDGVALSTTETTYLHIAVPAGVYDELYVTLYDDNNGVMYATVKAGDKKPLAAGKVREFKKDDVEQVIVYTPNDTAFVIKNVDDLYNFATSGLSKDAVLVNDIDLTKDEQNRTWTTISSSYKKTFHGNGYAINGLTKPLFKEVAGVIKGLHLTGVNIVETSDPMVGAIVRKVYGEATQEVVPTIEHCSASGSIKLNITSKEIETNNYKITVGGIAGQVYAGDVHSCTNNVNITIQQVTKTGTSKPAVTPNIGGIVGYSQKLETSGVTRYNNTTNCVNNGAIRYEDASGSTKSTATIGGIIGYSYDSNLDFRLSNCTNNGPISYDSTCNNLRIGGVIGMATGSNAEEAQLDNLTNNGAISVEGTMAGYVCCGGVGGYVLGADTGSVNKLYNNGNISVKDGSVTGGFYCAGGIGQFKTGKASYIYNRGNINVDSDFFFTATSIAGCIGHCEKDNTTPTCQHLYNYNPITVAGSSREGSKGLHRIGGTVGYSNMNLKNAYNEATGTITVSGNFNTNGNRQTTASARGTDRFSIGGVVAYKSSVAVTDSSNEAAIIFSGTEQSLHADGQLTQVTIGGAIGYTSINPTGVSNSGSVTMSGTINSELQMGGIVGYTYADNFTKKTNSGNLTISGTIKGGLSLGGCIGYLSDNTDSITSDMSGITNNGAITITSTAVIEGPIRSIGGVVGHTYGWTASGGLLQTSTNNGDISVGGTFGKDGESVITYIGGVIGNSQAASSKKGHKLTSLTNNGDVTTSASFVGEGCRLAGVATISMQDLNTANNNGTLTFAGSTSAGEVHMCGVATKVTGNITNCNNGSAEDNTKGALIFAEGATSYSAVRMGGITDDASGNVTSVTNYGAITFAGKSGYTFYGGGVSGYGAYGGKTWTDCVNRGKVNIAGSIGDEAVGKADAGADCFFGGILYMVRSGETKYVQCCNHGEIIITASVANCSRSAGVIARVEDANANVTMEDCANHGNIQFDYSTATRTEGACVSGGCIAQYSAGSLTVVGTLLNAGNISAAVVNNTAGQGNQLAGVIGNKTKAIVAGENALLKNTGSVAYTGSSKSTLYMGGIFAYGANCESPAMLNSGDITATGTYRSGSKSYIGGITGYAGAAITNATVTDECSIVAWNYMGVGMITGVSRTDTIKATDCQVAGTIDKGKNGLHYDQETDSNVEGWYSFVETLTAENFHNYIYGEPVEASVATEDSCSYYVRPTPAE